MKLFFNSKTLLFLGVMVQTTLSIGQTQVSGVDYLGKGYDVFGKYADPSSVKERLLSISNTDYISINTINSKRVEKVSGKDLREMSNQFAAKLKLGVGAFFFKGGIETSFAQESSSREAVIYSSIIDVSSQHHIKFDIEPKIAAEMKTLRSFLLPRAKERLNSKEYTPEDLFKIYGTHYLFSIDVGGSARYNTITRKTEQDSKETIAAAIEAEYKIFSGGASTELTSSQKSIVSQTKKNLYAIGGNSEFLHDINDKVAYKNWVKGIPTKSVLCGFNESSLRPIWELCENPERAKELEMYYKNVYIKKFPSPPIFVNPISSNTIKTKLLNNAFITQVFGGHFTSEDAIEFLSVDMKSGINLHFGDNLINTVNLISNNSQVDGVNFSVEKQSRIIAVEKLSNTGRMGFIITDGKGNMALYTIAKVGNTYQAKKFHAGSGLYNATVLTGKGAKYLILQQGDAHFKAYSLTDSKAAAISFDATNIVGSFGAEYISSMAKLGDINRDGFEEIYCTAKNGHFILSFDGTKFTAIKKFVKGEVIANAFYVGNNDFVHSIGDPDHNKNSSIVLYNENRQFTVLLPGNQTVILGANLVRDRAYGKFSINQNSEILGYLDIDGDNKDEVIFGADTGMSKNFQIVEILNTTSPQRVSHNLNY